MDTFITDDFMLQNQVAKELYHDYAKNEPIIDYHCHLPPDEIASNRKFETLYDIWLAGDHYKWRAMRTNGVKEEFCTGDASPFEKFKAWAATVPHTLRNPLYHWTHMELKQFFGINELLNEESAQRIWDQANEKLRGDELSVHGILKKNKVKVICTTDDPTDSLEHHQKIKESDLETGVYPTFRPDKAIQITKGEQFRDWLTNLQAITNTDCGTLSGFMLAIEKRHEFFHSIGGRLSDHGLSYALATPCTENQAVAIFSKVRSGVPVTIEDEEKFGSFMMVYFGQLDAKRNWTKQLHIGAMRNNNTRLFKALGPDTGFDSIGDYPQATALSRYLDALDSSNELPRTILYNLNPADNYVLGTMIGNFQDGSVPGKMQFGSGWWFLDQKEGMEWQINALSNLGLLSRFVGMLTDSRSFLSYSRHDYFRRILCNLIGKDVEAGELPRDMKMLGGMVKNISYGNARNFFGFEVKD